MSEQKKQKQKEQLCEKIMNSLILLTLIVIFLVIMPLSKCGEIPIHPDNHASKILIDMKSIYKEQNQKSKTYTFWTKYIKEQGYTLIEINIDCSNRSWAKKTWLEYEEGGELIESRKNNYYQTNRDSIIPHSLQMHYYEIVCQPHTRYIYKLESVYSFLKGKLPFEVGY